MRWADSAGRLAAALAGLAGVTVTAAVLATSPALGTSVVSYGTIAEASGSATYDAYDPDVAIDGSGNVAVVYQKEERHLLSSDEIAVELRERPAGGEFAAAEEITSFASTSSYDVDPQIAVNASGAIVIAWQQYDGDTASDEIYISTRTVGESSFSEPQRVSSAGVDATGQQVGIAADGAAYVTFIESPRSSPEIRLASGTVGDATFAIATVATPTASSLQRQELAVGSDGTAVLSWLDEGMLRAAYKSAGSGSFGSATSVSDTTTDANDYELAIGSDGLVAASWSLDEGSGRESVAYAARRSTGTWSSPVTLSTTGVNAVNPTVGVDGSGNALVVWSEEINSTSYELYAEVRNSGGSATWSQDIGRLEVDSSGEADQRVLVNDSGQAVLFWSTGVGETSSNTFAASTAIGSDFDFDSCSDLTHYTLPDSVGIDPEGSALAVWDETEDYDPGSRIVSECGASASGTFSGVSAAFLDADAKSYITATLYDVSSPTTSDDGAATSVAGPTEVGSTEAGGGVVEAADSSLGAESSGQTSAAVDTISSESAVNSAALNAGPVITSFRFTPSTFRVRGRSYGSYVRYALSEPATVKITVQRRSKHCSAAGKKCARYTRVTGAISRKLTATTGRLRFTGRVGGRALRPGRYRATIVATDADGNRSRARTANFKIRS